MSSIETSDYRPLTTLSGSKPSVAATKLVLVPAAGAAEQTAPARGMLVSVTRLIEALMNWRERGRQRRLLAKMDDYMLRDIGLSSADVAQETNKPLWRP